MMKLHTVFAQFFGKDRICQERIVEKINESVRKHLRLTQEDDEISQTKTMLQSYISTTVPSYSSNLDALIAGVQI
jgi:hypothetical protein